MATVGPRRHLGNFILDSLSQEEYEFLLHPHLKQVQLQQGQVLVGLRQPVTQIYFPVTATIAWLHSTAEGDTVEVGMAGFEGMVGTTLLFNQEVSPWVVGVQLTGEALQIDVPPLVHALQQSSVLHQAVSNFGYQKMVQLTQSALCNRFHTAEQRLCRWLLATQDRVNASELLLTRDILATMIGSTRPAVSIVTGTLQSAGLIHSVRGKVTILDREEMEEATCECYHILKQQFDRYLQK